MVARSISEFYRFSLYIFDLDNTIFKEEDYLFDGYREISSQLAILFPHLDEDKLFLGIKEIFEKEGRTNLFDKFLKKFDIDQKYLQTCLIILRTFKPTKKYRIFSAVLTILKELQKLDKKIFVLTNGNPSQQRNKISNIDWDGVEGSIHFVFADEIVPKPSPAGIEYILKISNEKQEDTILIGDSDSDASCASAGKVTFLNIKYLNDIPLK